MASKVTSKKVYADAAVGTAGRGQGWHDADVRRIRRLRHPGESDRRAARIGSARPDGGIQQRRARRRGLGLAAAGAANPQNDFFLCGREQGIRAAVPGGRSGDRIQSAGHAGRADSRGRRRDLWIFHQDRRRHAGGRRQGDAHRRRRDLRAREGPGRRCVPGQGVEGRYRGQS